MEDSVDDGGERIEALLSNILSQGISLTHGSTELRLYQLEIHQTLKE